MSSTSLPHKFGLTVLPSASAGKLKTEQPVARANWDGKKFINPWPSYRERPASTQLLKIFNATRNRPKVPADIASLIPVHKPDWGIGSSPDAVKATWLGHACYLVELPAPEGASRGPRLIFDPALSHRCSPSQFIGPARFTPVPCATEEIPQVDAIIISHNHYDHTDTATLRKLYKMHQPHIFVPLGVDAYMKSIGIPSSHIHALDWWDSRDLSLKVPTAGEGSTAEASFRVTCTPSQHMSGRSLTDRMATLWSSWAVEEVLPAGSKRDPKKVYFAGDTGYRTVYQDEDATAGPVCPAFSEIGERLGPFDLAMIPIGAYAPQWLFSHMHVSTADSVNIFRDIRAKKALGMHWGAWSLTVEDIMEPPKLLRKECDAAGIPASDFDICPLGGTKLF